MSKVILGGGLSGLSAAYYLQKLSPQQKTILIESSNRLGGWIKTFKQNNGIIFEMGPRTIRPAGETGINTLNLIDELGLSNDVMPIYKNSPAAKNRMIYVNGELYSLPNSISGLIYKQQPFSKPLLFYLLNDLKSKAVITEDESIHNFIQRRFGSEVADYLIGPLIRGICGGNAKEVSVNFLMENLFRYEQTYGSISKGLLKHLFDKKRLPARGHLARLAKNDQWSVYTFRDGLETLPKTIETRINHDGNIKIFKNSKCVNIEFSNKYVNIHLENGQIYTADHLISAIPSKHLVPLIQSQHAELAELFNKIKAASIAVVNLHYKDNCLEKPGFGFLVPPKEKLPFLGVIYDSCCRPVGNDTVLTVMMGGYWFKELFGDNPKEDYLLDVAVQNLKTILKTSDPFQYKVTVLRDCIPQYVVGHQNNLKNIENYIKEKQLPLSICGSSYRGVGVNDVIFSAKKAVISL